MIAMLTKQPYNSTTHCCRCHGGKALADPEPCTPSCEGFYCDGCFAALEHNEDFLDGAVSLAPHRAVHRCAFCKAPVPTPKRGAPRKFCGPKCKNGAAKALNAARVE